MVNRKQKVIFQGSPAFVKQNVWTEFLEEIAEEYGFQLRQMVYSIVSREMIRKANIDYLQHDYDTDVITFDYSKRRNIAGEALICFEVVCDNAEQLRVTPERELERVLIHAFLHLIGFNDLTVEDRVQMRKKEDEYLINLDKYAFRV